MNLKLIHRWLAIFLFGFLLFFFGNQGVNAQYSLENEIVLERSSGELISPVIERDKAFNAVILKSEFPIDDLMINFNPSIDAWEPIEIHDDGFGPNAIFFTSPTRFLQLKKPVDGDENSMVFKAEFLFAEVSVFPDEFTENIYSGPELAAAGLKIISRRGWQADENLRYWTPETEELFKRSGQSYNYKNPCGDMDTKFANEVRISQVVKTGPRGETLIWPLVYSKNIEKIVVHHTDSDVRDLNGDFRMDSRDYKAMVQAIYYFHSITRGWGDIGYNYLIDPLGNVYEGRSGGERVIGAHAKCYNNGSIGIALIGNYEKKNIPEPAFNSLVTLIASKAKRYNIDPRGESVFRGKRMQNVIGHRDVVTTSCPGKRLYAMLPKIRERSQLLVRTGQFQEGSLSSQTLDYNAQSIGSAPSVVLLPNHRKKITLRFKNTGKKIWDNNTWLHVSLNNRKNVRVVPIIEDKTFVAANMKESRVSPGGTATFEVEFEAGYFAGSHEFEVAPVVNGRYKVSRSAVFIPLYIKEPELDYQIVKQSLPSGTVFQGQKLQASVVLKNTGNIKWVNFGNNPIRLGTEDLRDRKSKLVKKHATRVAHLLESEVLPGENGTFIFNLEVPLRFEGKLKERFSPVIENISWLENKNMGFEIFVKKPRHSAKVISKPKIPKMLPGERKRIELTFENGGDLPWDHDNVKIILLGRGIKIFKKFMSPGEEIRPKKTVDYSFWIQAPYLEGRHLVSLRSKFNSTTIRGGTVRFLINVPKPRLRAQMVSQTNRSISLNPGREKEIEVKFKNLGNTVWQQKGENAIHLGTSRPSDRRSQLYHDDWLNKFRAASMSEKEVHPGEIGTFRFKVKSDRKGVYRENFQLVIENVGWLDSSFVRWDFRVFGDRKKSSTSTSRSVRTTVTTRISAETPKVTTVEEPTVTSKTSTVTSDALQGEKPFRVRISYGSSESRITANKNYKVLGDSGELLFSVGAGTVIELRRVGSNIHVQLGNSGKTSGIVRVVPENGGIVEILSMERRPTWNTKLNDNRFRGVIEVREVNGETAFINELPLEDYLKGLAEVSNDALTEKQKVISVLARTYAKFYMSDSNRKFPGLPYDGSDDPAIFQRYLGYGYELRSPNFIRAAAATRGQVVTYNGKLIKTPYFNQSSGRTLSADEVWGWTNTPYLQSVDDPHCAGLVLRGHGVGLSGCGADGMANEGKKYEEIIKYYYQGVEIE